MDEDLTKCKLSKSHAKVSIISLIKNYISQKKM